MAPKIPCNPQKLASCVNFFRSSRTCWNIKDLEKQLASVASINSMQVKDYLQSLTDDSRIKVEKIGSGNWYWSFASQDKRNKQEVLDNTRAEYERAAATVDELRRRVDDISAQHEEEETMLDNGEESREELTASKAVLEKDLRTLQKQLQSYSDFDPTELERKRGETRCMLEEAEKIVDDILSIEQWFKVNSGPDCIPGLREGYYGNEWDSEEHEFKTLLID